MGSYEFAGDFCIIGFTHRVDVGIDPYAYLENFRKSVRTRVPGNLPGKEPMKHGRGLGSGGSILRVQAEVIAAQNRLGGCPLHGGKRCLAYCARVRIAGEVGALDGLLAEVLCVTCLLYTSDAADD